MFQCLCPSCSLHQSSLKQGLIEVITSIMLLNQEVPIALFNQTRTSKLHVHKKTVDK